MVGIPMNDLGQGFSKSGPREAVFFLFLLQTLNGPGAESTRICLGFLVLNNSACAWGSLQNHPSKGLEQGNLGVRGRCDHHTNV